MAVEATIKVEVAGVEPFKGLVEAVVAYRAAFRGPAFTSGSPSVLAITRNAMFEALDALNADEALWHEEQA